MRRTVWSRSSALVRVAVLLATPAFFRLFGLGFMWHSIYWGAITFVLMLWGAFILLSPLFGRVGCGWFCFVGSAQDLAGAQSPLRVRRGTPFRVLRLLGIVAFFGTAGLFFWINVQRGLIPGWRFAPFHLGTAFTAHYQHVWLYDVGGALLMGFLLPGRWMCRHLCVVGWLCELGARHARWVVQVDREACNDCGVCEQTCPAAVPIRESAARHGGLVADGDCLLCGACGAACGRKAVSGGFVWKRPGIPVS